MSESFQEKRVLGRTGLKVSRLGIAAGYGAEAKSIEKAFYESAVNYFVTGRWKSSGMRAALGNMVRKDREEMVIAAYAFDHLGWFLKGGVEKTLKRLGTGYIDILILSWFNNSPAKRILDRAIKLKEEGKIRFIGMSGHNRKTFGKLAQDPGSPVDVFMTRYNAVHTGAEQDVFPFLQDENRPGITTYTATCWRKLMNPKKMPDGETVLSAADCYRFVLSNPYVDVCLTGPSSSEQLEQNIEALNKGPLSEEEMARIRAIGQYIYKS